MSKLSPGQDLALDQLQQIASGPGAGLEVLGHSVNELNGILSAEVSLDCADTPGAPGGIALRPRERFFFCIGRDFPFSTPTVEVPHERWGGTPHVQWGKSVCIYADTALEWSPADGMYGLIGRLTLWLKAAALGELDPDDQPLHPPVAYSWRSNGMVVVRSDLGPLAPQVADPGRRAGSGGSELVPPPRLVVGLAVQRNEFRRDVVEWMTLVEWVGRHQSGDLQPTRDGHPVGGVVGILCSRELSFEFPVDAATLVGHLEALGLDTVEFLVALGYVATTNKALAIARDPTLAIPFHLDLFVGTPSRRMPEALRQHLVCWRFDDAGCSFAEDLALGGAEKPDLAELRAACQRVGGWIASTSITWVWVSEAREEVVLRRDAESNAAWLANRNVLLLGCGALGAPIAEACVRAGVSSLRVLDNDSVTPGILVRQPYVDEEIGTPKALALASRLNKIHDDQRVQPVVGPAEATLLAEGVLLDDLDLIIDATANNTVASLLELRHAQGGADFPAVLSVMIGHDARRGVVGVAGAGASGAGRDVMRRLALAARGSEARKFADVAEDMFPVSGRGPIFQPEPGCSSPTFVGSAAQLGALAGGLFEAGLEALGSEALAGSELSMMAGAVRLAGSVSSPTRGVDWVGWPNDTVIREAVSGYEVRISQAAMNQMRTEVRRGKRLRGEKIETGGLLLGQIDDACRCIWIDQASGPPPDSRLSAYYFEHGVEGVNELIEHYRERSGRLSVFVGMWHSHPLGHAEPSPTDRVAMARLVTPLKNNPNRTLVLIVGGNREVWGGWLAEGTRPELFGELAGREGHAVAPAPLPVPPGHLASAWPGGWGTPKKPPVEKRARLRLRKRWRQRRVSR